MLLLLHAPWLRAQDTAPQPMAPQLKASPDPDGTEADADDASDYKDCDFTHEVGGTTGLSTAPQGYQQGCVGYCRVTSVRTPQTSVRTP
jgi:hypothetical protein